MLIFDNLGFILFIILGGGDGEVDVLSGKQHGKVLGGDCREASVLLGKGGCMVFRPKSWKQAPFELCYN